MLLIFTILVNCSESACWRCAGLEFEDAKIPVGQFGTMRLAASVDFPRELPLQDGEQPFRLRIMRLGVKSRLM